MVISLLKILQISQVWLGDCNEPRAAHLYILVCTFGKRKYAAVNLVLGLLFPSVFGKFM